MTLRKHGVRTEVLRDFSCKGNYCSEVYCVLRLDRKDTGSPGSLGEVN